VLPEVSLDLHRNQPLKTGDQTLQYFPPAKALLKLPLGVLLAFNSFSRMARFLTGIAVTE